jgi:xanthine dehydrogenase small subunit
MWILPVIKFLLNQTEHTVENIDPNTSLLDYLREHLHRTGTKEGCASGDCGACTVAIGSPDQQGKIRYQSANACMTLVGSLHGKQLLTVEDLKTESGLHVVQQAMVDCHGSQCGFCTPGFVMSMFAYHKNSDAPDTQEINEALGGNLCRCTGYRPIQDAAVHMFEPQTPDQFSDRESDTYEHLQSILSERDSIELSHENKRLFSPVNSDELADLYLKFPQARLVAGGTDLSLELSQALASIDVLIHTGHVADLEKIEEGESHLNLGAACTYSTAKQLLVKHFPDLHELIERLGSLQIRNQGTIAGNVGNASPIGDMPPVLIALGAHLTLRKGDRRREVLVQDYYISYKKTVLETSEFIESISIPYLSENELFKAYKISKRLEDDISASCAAIKICLQDNHIMDAKIAFGGMAEIPKRAGHAELALIKQDWSEASFEQAMKVLGSDFSPISDFRSSADYRLAASKNLLMRFFLEINLGSNTTRVTHYA